MKILLVTRKLPPPTNLGAVPTMLLSVAQGLVEAGIEVDVLAGPPSKTRVESPREGLTIHRFDDESVSTIELMSTTRDLLRDVDLVHIHDVLPLGLGILNLVAESPVPRVWTIHNFSPLCTNSFLWPPCSLVRDEMASGPPDLCYVDRSPDCRRCFRAGLAGWIRYSAFILRSKLARRAASRFHLITPSGADSLGNIAQTQRHGSHYHSGIWSNKKYLHNKVITVGMESEIFFSRFFLKIFETQFKYL